MQENELLSFLVSSGILVALVGLGITGIKFLKVWLDAKIAVMLENLHNEKVADAIRKAENAVTLAVVQTAQLEADAFKAAAADGKLTNEEKIQLRDLAKERAISLINNDIAGLIVEDINDFDGWLNTQIENAVWYSKK
jgi:hypothetical protein